MSQAAALGWHAMALLARRAPSPLSTKEMAAALQASAAHLSKVLQRLAKAGIVLSERGPGGGYRLAKAANRLTLLRILEAIDGPLAPDACLMRVRVCPGKKCLLGDLLTDVNHRVRRYFAETTLSDICERQASRQARVEGMTL